MHEMNDDGEPALAVDGYEITSRDYLVKAAEGRAPLSKELNLRSINESPRTLSMSYHMTQYLMRRGDATVRDWETLNANSKYATNSREVAMKNWENAIDITSDGITRRVKMRDAMRLVLLKVMQQNDIDVLVNPTITIPPALIGHASEPVVKNRPNGRFPTSANLGIPEITVPAGFNSVIYEPHFKLNEDKTRYESAANSTEPTVLDKPMPYGISFWAGPGDEPILLEVASAYEVATGHRQPPADFGPVGKPGK
jgi:Asp-tRNA(Asn)/Glu-tRNA(Gln) amidotransferase A subunit family amidase